MCLTFTTLVQAQNIQLPAPQKSGGMPLMEALNARQTQRTFSAKPLSEQQLADLLWAAFGINRENGKRTAPSAHNKQEISIYVALPSGLYLYQAKANTLEKILDQDIRAQTGKQPFVKIAPVCLIFVSDYDRMKTEAEFYSATDTGYISQNVYLFCASEGLGTVVRGYVDKEGLAKTMNLAETQHVVLAQTVGYPKPAAEKAPEKADKAEDKAGE
jgi:SagB-type dehydrogenase family enzyme